MFVRAKRLNHACLPAASPPQITSKLKTILGVELNRESIFIGDIVIDEDGSLKIKQIQQFTDSKDQLEFTQAIAAAKAKK
jgi:hypothetical protein